MNIVEILKWRYATKKFDHTKKLSSDKVNVLKEAFNLTATSYGLQPIKLVIVESQDIKENLVAHSWGQKQVSEASHLLIFCIEKSIDTDYIKKYFKRVKDIRNTPDEVLKNFQNFLIDDFEKKTTEDIYTWATKQAYLAMGNLLTVCAVEGIDACPMEGFLPDEYDKLLNLDDKGLKSVLAMPVGYRADDDMFSEMKKVRKNVDESIISL